MRARLSAFFRNPMSLALGVILIAAFVLRIYDLNWDQGQYLHPDERYISDVITSRIVFEWPPEIDNLLDPEHSFLNPRSNDPNTERPRDFAYGSLPLFITDLTGSLLFKMTGNDWSAYYGKVYEVGRVLSALFDTLTVLLVYLIGRRVASKSVGVLAAIVAAFTPMAIQLAHFFTTDSWLTFFVALTLLWTIEASDTGRFRWFLASGLAVGLAMATKGSVFTLGGIVVVAAIFDLWNRRNQEESKLELISSAAAKLCLAGMGALVTFAVFEPYAIARPRTYVDQILNQADIVSGTFDVPFTRQYIGTTPVVYQIEQIVRWGYGPVAGILIAIGGIVLAMRFFSERRAAQAILLAWFAGYGLVISIPETKFLRYLAPLMPVFAIFCGIAIDAIRVWLMRFQRPRIPALATGALLIGIALWTAAFMNVYAEQQPRITASQWIYANVPPGSVLSSEYWDDALPLGLSDALNANSYQYSWVGIDLYNSAPGDEAADTIYAMMSNVDYIIISSNRVMSSLPHSPWRYPVQIEYYQLLTSGQLGFEQVAEFQTKPGIGPFQIDDRNADESFINYDHPRVMIFQKTSMIPRETYDALMAEAVAQPVISQRHANTDTIMLDEPVGNLPVVNDARWSSSLTDNSLIAAIWWILFLFILQAVGLPIAMAAFRRFGDRGWAFARLLSLIIAGWLVWILASIEVISFRAYWCWIALALLAIPWLIRRSPTMRRFRWAMSDRQTRRTMLVGEVIFWATFGIFLLFRYLNPDSWHPSWGGEKPMEFAHINAILRSAHFPPYDPWYSGGYINYYYYGSYLVAFCMKATGIPSEIAFNLAQPTFVAFLALAAYGLSATLGRMLTRTKASAPVIGVFGAVMLTFIGNLFAARKLIEAFPDIPAFTFGDWTWGATRLITNNGKQQIAEFPYFTGLYADLHAHMIAESITVLCLAVGLAIALEARPIVVAVTNRSIRQAATPIGLTLLAALVVGTLYPTNTWDFFTYAAFIIASLFVGFRFLSLTPRLILSGITGIMTVALGYVLFLPFHTHFVTLFSSVERTGNQTDIWQFNEHFGGLLIVTLLGMIALTWTRMPPGDYALTPTMAVRIALLLLGLILVLHLGGESDDQLLAVIVVIGFSWLSLVNAGWWSTDGPRFLGQPWNRHFALIGGIISFGLVLDERFVLGLCLALAVMSATLWIGFNGTGEKHLSLMLAAGTAVAGVIEIVYVADNLNGGDWERMNTMFKFYNQAWILIALCGGTLLGWATWNAFTNGKLANLRKPEITSSALGVVVIGMLVIAAGFMYPLTSTKPRLEERFTTDLGSGTLNALDWMNYGTLQSPTGEVIAFNDDLAAINWFNEHVSGTPVIAEASIGPYRGNGSRIAIATGLPTVLGWDNHETQQRYLEGITSRYQDVRRLYQSDDPAEKMDILNQYGVEYVVVGDVERYSMVGNQLYATPEGIAAFDQMVGNGLEIAFQRGGTTVYRVVPVEAATVGQAK